MIGQRRRGEWGEGEEGVGEGGEGVGEGEWGEGEGG